MKECPVCNHCYDDNMAVCPDDGRGLTASLPGSCLIDDKYLLETCLGRGGMGAVYRARHTRLKRAFAVKTILPEFANRDAMAKERFEREAHSLAAIQHPNVIAITDFGTTATGVMFFVMEYVEGKTLQTELANAKDGVLPAERVLHLFRQILLGVAAAHRQNTVHRDLKPGNILLTKLERGDNPVLLPLDESPEDNKATDWVKIFDFGLAKFTSRSSFLRTDPQEVIGTPYYMSPEQCEGDNIDERSDIYSLGVILYQMLTGTVPFKGNSASEVLTSHLMKEPPRLRAVNAKIPEKLEKVVLKALDKKPSARYQTVNELAEEFETAMAAYLVPKANLTVRTLPPSSEVYIGDRYCGRTNSAGRLVISDLAAGEYKLRVALSGYIDNFQKVVVDTTDQEVVITLQSKDEALAAAAAAAAPTRRLDRSLPPTSRPAPVAVESWEQVNPNADAALNYGDLLLSLLMILLELAVVITSQPLDPVSGWISERFEFPASGVGSIISLISLVGFTITLLLADSSNEYRHGGVISSIYHLCNTAITLVIVVPWAIAIPLKFFANSPLVPAPQWFLLRLGVIMFYYAFQRRVSRRRRVTFV
jgi:eukaryotic-like serine/threonine-protein kinase